METTTQKKDELLTAEEVLLKHGLNWGVEKRPVYDRDGKELTDYKAITRDSDGHIFQVSKNKYECISNRIACGLLDEVVGSGLAKYIGATSFKDGALVMINAEVPDLEYRLQGDSVKNFIHIATSHDGSASTFIFGSQQKLRCQNLLTSTMKQDVETLKFKHTMNYRMKIEDFKVVFNAYRQVFQNQKDAFNKMAEKEMNQLEYGNFLDKLLKIDSTREDNITTRTANIKKELERLFVDGIAHNEMPDTRWKAFNAITQYVTHEKSTRGDESNREFSNYFTGGATLRQRAQELLIA